MIFGRIVIVNLLTPYIHTYIVTSNAFIGIKLQIYFREFPVQLINFDGFALQVQKVPSSDREDLQQDATGQVPLGYWHGGCRLPLLRDRHTEWEERPPEWNINIYDNDGPARPDWWCTGVCVCGWSRTRTRTRKLCQCFIDTPQLYVVGYRSEEVVGRWMDWYGL